MLFLRVLHVLQSTQLNEEKSKIPMFHRYNNILKQIFHFQHHLKILFKIYLY